MKKKSIFTAVLAAVMVLGVMAGCQKKTTATFDTAKEIGVISREEGSGTRGAFIELFGIEQKNDAGEKIDHTTDKAVITDKNKFGDITPEQYKEITGIEFISQ